MPELICELHRGVYTIRLNRPERMNALSQRLRDELLTAVTYAAESDEVRVVVLTGTGEKAFCAGRDLKELHTELSEGRRSSERWRSDVSPWEVLLELGKPTIAAVNGVAAGGGFELALACDLRVAVQGVLVGLPEVKIGLAATFGSALLMRSIPRPAAYQMIYSGRLVPAEDLERWGFFNSVVERTQFDAAVSDLALSMAESAPLALQRYKDLGTRGWGGPVTDAFRMESIDLYSSQDIHEGVQAFVEKRGAQWSGQ